MGFLPGPPDRVTVMGPTTAKNRPVGCGRKRCTLATLAQAAARRLPFRARMAGEEVVMKILVGVDDSPCSKAALEMVKTIRWPAGTHVNVVSAVHVPTPIYTDAYVPAAIDNWGEVMAAQRQQSEEL